MKESAAVVNARQPVDHAIVASHDVEKQPVDAGVHAEEAVRAEIDALAPQIERARQAADAIASLVNDNLRAPLGQAHSGGNACRTGADYRYSHLLPLRRCRNVVLSDCCRTHRQV